MWSGFELVRQIFDPWSARATAVRTGYCNVCARMLGTPEGIQQLCYLPGYRHHKYAECRESAKQGCRLCAMIFREGWEGNKQTVDEEKLQGAAPLCFVARRPNSHGLPISDGDAARAWVGLISRGIGDISWLEGGFFDILKPPKPSPQGKPSRQLVTWSGLVTLVAMASYDNPAGEYFPERIVCDSFMDDQVMEEAIKWIADCIEGRHDRCVYLGDPQLPTRVLDVKSGSGSMVRLHATQANDFDKYAALSYCWGGPQPLTTTKSNMTQLMAGIEVSALPKSLRDAVLTTQRLGLQYLWIDALCIIQDSDEDKINEIEKMGMIYRNATITLAASNGRAASDGFLKASMENRSTSACTVPVCLPQTSQVGQVTLEVRPRKGHPKTSPEPLRSRGWAFQEAILSQRLLIFSKYELRCHCRNKNRRSLNLGSFAQNVEPELWSIGVRYFEELDRHRKEQGDGWLTAAFMNSMWYGMIRDFTSRALTVPDDRLRAVQGIANELLQSPHWSTAGDVKIDMDLDEDEFGSEVSCVYYLLLAKYVNHSGPRDTDPLMVYYVSGIVVVETEKDRFKRLGYFRWDVWQPAEEEFLFGGVQRRGTLV